MRRILVLLTLGALLAGCTPHRIDIQQGNIVSRERLALVKPGMDPQQVRFALGSPLVRDPFRPDRWDYFYSLNSAGELKHTYRVTLHFQDGKLVRVEDEGEIPATERDALEMVTR
ncbi:MAG: outer membrane protein assembly factor BamE [Thiohalomonadaceae bacterium]